MEPLDTDIDYMGRESRPSTLGSRFNALLIFPILGFLLLLVFLAAAIFQLNISDLIDTLMGVLTVLFLVFIAMLFWASAPRVNRS